MKGVLKNQTKNNYLKYANAIDIISALDTRLALGAHDIMRFRACPLKSVSAFKNRWHGGTPHGCGRHAP